MPEKAPNTQKPQARGVEVLRNLQHEAGGHAAGMGGQAVKPEGKTGADRTVSKTADARNAVKRPPGNCSGNERVHHDVMAEASTHHEQVENLGGSRSSGVSG